MTSIEEDTERLLENWALFREGGVSIAGRSGEDLVSSGYDPEQWQRASGYREARVPVLVADALEVDAVILSLDVDQRVALNAHYRYRGPLGELIPSHFTHAQIAEELRLGTRTFERHLQYGRRAVWNGYNARRIARVAGVK
jgi:DNA-directed RNA polymerase specialized sigma24 family protein